MAVSKNKSEDMLREMLKSDCGRKKIAASLVSPIRCGGCDYIDGKPFLRIGGKLYTKEQVDKMR